MYIRSSSWWIGWSDKSNLFVILRRTCLTNTRIYLGSECVFYRAMMSQQLCLYISQTANPWLRWGLLETPVQPRYGEIRVSVIEARTQRCSILWSERFDLICGILSRIIKENGLQELHPQSEWIHTNPGVQIWRSISDLLRRALITYSPP